MSRGALLQLVAKGEVDEYLTDNSIKKSIFQSVYKKITNFSVAPYSFYPTGNSTWGDTIRFRINKIGDLISNMYLVLELPHLSVADILDASPTDNNVVNSTLRVKWNDYIGNTIIENVKLKIGGQTIDEMTGEYLQFNTELYDYCWSKICMMGHHPSLTFPKTIIEGQYIYIPLRFFFCNDITKALPIIALEYHDVEIEIKLRTWDYTYLVLSQITAFDGIDHMISKMNFSHTDYKIAKKEYTDIRLDCRFIFLDDNERVDMVKKRHEILITQTQKLITYCNNNDSIYLNFTNPIKELVFAFQRTDYAQLGELFNYSGKPVYIPLNPDNTMVPEITDRLWNQIPDKHLLENMSIEFNGVERVPTRDYKYWHFVQNYECYKTKFDHNIYMYSFGLNSKENMGSCNFSMLETIRLNVTLSKSDTYSYLVLPDPLNPEITVSPSITVGPSNNTSIRIYATNYNVFVIESGMGGIMYTI